MTSTDPEIGSSINAAGITTNYHDMGDGDPVLLIHGSGPGVSAWANWRTVMPALSRQHRVIAPDIVGFGYTDRPDDFQFIRDSWTAHLVALLRAGQLDEMEIHLVPVLLGAGRRLFETRDTDPIELQLVRRLDGRDATHLRYQIR